MQNVGLKYRTTEKYWRSAGERRTLVQVRPNGADAFSMQ